eukprot:8025062-Alexandrium_andersonii.AAC.1
MLRPVLSSCSSMFERLKRFRILRMAVCGLRWIAILPGLGRIADCTLGTLQCKDARLQITRVRSLSCRACRTASGVRWLQHAHA